MTAERQQQVERTCQEALDRRGLARSEYLASACQGDVDLRRDVESLLACEPAAERFIEAPAIEQVAHELATTGTLRAGARLGAYEVLSPLGSGGMGDVYRARDTTLGRQVAIKVLPALFLSDPARRGRFEQEARMLAALNHPHIAAIYGVDDSSGMPALVLELVEGETLETLLVRAGRGRPAGLPRQKALDIARQIADALEAAHDKGIIHRDLKPSNIKVTPDGVVKVLDFGVATVLVDDDAAREHPESAAAATLPGAIVGTAAYMSPEQAQGLPIDKRTDIWAFGCVLFEMLTGRRAFEGEGGSATLANVMAREPEWTALPEQISSSVSRLLRRCLQKDRRQRLADIADARLEIEEALASAAGDVPRARRGLFVRERIAWGAAAICAIALAVTLAYRMRLEDPLPRPVTFNIDVHGMSAPFMMAVSPDGSRVAYSAVTDGGTMGLWVHSLESNESRLLPGTEGAFHSDWSPDSRFIVFAAGGKLKKVDILGGLPQALTDAAADLRRSAWSDSGVILFANGPTIRRAADTGGASTDATELDTSLQEISHSTPSFLPDGRHFLYTAWSNDPEQRAVYVGSLDSSSRIRLMTSDSKAVYSPPGFILFRQGDTLMARPFDATRLRFIGDPQPLVEGVHYSPSLGQSAFSASLQGTLAYVRNAGLSFRLAWLDRSGTARALGSAQSNATSPRLSSDGRRIAFHRGEDIWIYNVDRDQEIRLTNDPSVDRFPLWSPDGSRVAFGSNRSDPSAEGLYDKASNGAIGERLMLPGKRGNAMVPRDWARNSGSLIFESGGGFGQQRDIWVLPLSSNSAPVPYLATSVDERHPALSPDGHWLAYTSNESGTYQVVVQTFPDPALDKVTIGAGRFPRWKGDGRELYYIDSHGRMVAASVKTAPSFQVTKTTVLFDAPFVPAVTDLTIPYDVTADGQRFLMSTPVASPSTPGDTTLTVVLGWPALLQDRD